MYPETSPRADFVKIEHEILGFWRSDNTFEKSLSQTRSGQPFSFYDGPPFANGLPHWGHLGVSAVKDMVSRYQTMNGRHVVRELGWDCHGVPAEGSVEKKQNRAAKDIVADNGIYEFCEMCRADVTTYTHEWLTFIERIGRWVNPTPAAVAAGGGDEFGYRTMDLKYMECVIGTLAKLYDKGLLYQDYRVNPYDWKMGTVLSNSEASADYRDAVDDAITVWFELADGRRVMAWTTTPWTLPANSALAVNPKLNYAVMRDGGHEYIVAESRLSAYEKQFENTERVGTVSGADLVGLRYKPLFNYYTDEKLFQILSADYVGDDSGTGIVHIAPAFGEDDFWAAKNLDVHFPVIVNVDTYGNFDDTVTDFAGMNIFDANPKIIEYLKSNGHLVKKEQYKHSYPYGERSKEKLIYRATESWYIDVPKIKDALIANNTHVNWTSAGGRFSDWIANARPWAISRNRFWGTPLPIWTRDGEYKIFGSIKEINEFFDTDVQDLHRPTLDKLSKDGWNRISDVLDCWVESGAMPWASVGFNPYIDTGLPAGFPADYIIEGQDQTRGWFYSLMVLSAALFDMPAFKTVSANGMVVDENKKKFSKSVGNFVNPEQQIEQFGADAIRLFILGSNFMKAEPLPVDKQGKVFTETIKSILMPLWNAYHFFTLYANAGGIIVKTKDKGIEIGGNILDEYIITELDNLTDIVRGALDGYKPDGAVREFVLFLDILNNWYIRRSRDRFWDEEQGAFDTLHYVLTGVCKLMAPFAPFISEYIYKNLTNDASVHLCEFPKSKKIKTDLLSDMRRVQSVVAVGKMLREKHGLRNRLPLAKMTVAGINMSEFSDIIKDELNLKEVVFDDDFLSVADSFVYLITPKIGARLGGALKEIIPAVKSGNYTIDSGQLIIKDYILQFDEFETRLTVKPDVPGAALPDNTAVVVLDTELNSELIAEGLANDALRFIQDTRKGENMDVSDRIKLEYSADPALRDAIEKYRKNIMDNALIVDMEIGLGKHTTEIEGYAFSIKIQKV